jgi:hypothetical protein
MQPAQTVPCLQKRIAPGKLLAIVGQNVLAAVVAAALPMAAMGLHEADVVCEIPPSAVDYAFRPLAVVWVLLVCLLVNDVYCE